MRLQRIFTTANPATPRSGFALGALHDDDGRIFFTTFEDKPIPAGTYICRLLPHPIHGVCWEVCDVPNRTGILFHVGNDATDSEGCILVGFGFSGPAITFSADAYKRFRQFLAARREFSLVVADPSK